MKRKIGYFWDYYKWFVIIPLLLIAFGWSLYSGFRKENKEPLVSVALINAQMSDASDITWNEEYLSDRKAETDEELRIETGLIHPKADASADMTAAASIQKYQSMLTTGYVDVTIETSWVIDAYGEEDSYLNLQEVLSDAYFQKLKEEQCLYYIEKNGKQIPVGIVADQIERVKQFYPQLEPIITISDVSERKQEAVSFIEWLLDGKEEAGS